MAHAGYTLMTWLSLPLFVSSVDLNNDWKPIKSELDVIIEPNSLPHTRLPGRKISPVLNSCSLYKTSMDQHTFHQYMQYKHHIPDLHEFTLCAWIKLFNYSSDHSLFSYGFSHKPQTIGAKISNTAKKTWYMLIVNGHTLYRINYPTKLFKWYHVCQSWNGKTGEWQIWINSERISRGYYNLMVGKTMKSGGTAISGQDQLDRGDGTFSFTKRKLGFQGELTLLQLYKAALSKGKAYSDHRHHHGQSDDDHMEPTADPNATEDPNKEQTTEHPFLENGQLKPRLPVHELLAKNPVMLTESPFSSSEQDSAEMLLKFKDTSFDTSFPRFFNFPYIRDDEKKMKFDSILGRLKRNVFNHTSAAVRVEREHLARYPITRHLHHQTKSTKKYQSENIRPEVSEIKRALVLNPAVTAGGFDSHLNSGFSPFYSGLSAYPYQDTLSIFKDEHFNQEKFPTKLEYETAEWEVRKIAEVCSACDEDPFRKASVLSWQDTPKKLFAGAEYVPAIPKCHIF